jgi:hypothetical protein
MKRRDHTASVSCLLAAVVFLLIQGAAVAQEFMPPPAGYPGTPSLVVGRFYIQGGVQYRNVTRFAFERSTRTVLDPYQWGTPPFGPDRQNYWDPIPFGTGTPNVGYPNDQTLGYPTGVATDAPTISGIWVYNNGSINPNGDGGFVWPNNPWSATPVIGLGQYSLSGGGVFNIGVFTISTPSNQVGTGATPGFDPDNPPVMANTYSVTWQRVLDATVDDAPEAGVESILYQYNGRQFNQEYQTNIWSPSIELGFQWTNFFDLFTAFSWYDISRNLSKSFTGGTTDLLRRAFRDTFPFGSDNDSNWPTSPTSSNTIIGGNEANQQILPDSPGVIGYPRRQFFLVNYGLGNATANETINLHSDVRVYEWRSGVRSWVPLYGMGRFGVIFGPMMSILNWNASEHGIYTFLIPNVPDPSVFETFDNNNGTLTSFGLFGGLDVEIAMNRWYAKFTGQYNLSEQKALANSQYTDTNVNLSGFTYIVSGGLRF